MKKLMLIVLSGIIFVALSLAAFAQEDDECPCGVDEQTGDCLPCPPGE